MKYTNNWSHDERYDARKVAKNTLAKAKAMDAGKVPVRIDSKTIKFERQ